MALQRLKEAAEKAKIELSSLLSTTINLPFITADASGPRHLEISLTRAKFEELTRDLVEASMGPTRQALADAGLKPVDVDKILLVGGSTRIPAVQEAITGYFGKEPHKGINPDECVAMGAAIQAGVLAGEVKDVPVSYTHLDVYKRQLLTQCITHLLEKTLLFPALSLSS